MLQATGDKTCNQGQALCIPRQNQQVAIFLYLILDVMGMLPKPLMD